LPGKLWGATNWGKCPPTKAKSVRICFYSSGEQIRKGDRVLLHGEPGEIELVADPAESPDDWFVKNQGGGIMVLELKVFGRLFIPAPETDEHLTFISRQTKQ
jgi:hypothetical protein